jgi:hypothetical protein
LAKHKRSGTDSSKRYKSIKKKNWIRIWNEDLKAIIYGRKHASKNICRVEAGMNILAIRNYEQTQGNYQEP